MNALFLPKAAGDTLWTFLGSPLGLLACWLLLINVLTFFIFGLDKWKAKRKEKHPQTRRVPEKTLFLLAAMGGSVGALLGMSAFHHKTLHRSFRFGVPAILLAQLALAAVLVWLRLRH